MRYSRQLIAGAINGGTHAIISEVMVGWYKSTGKGWHSGTKGQETTPLLVQKDRWLVQKDRWRAHLRGEVVKYKRIKNAENGVKYKR